MDKLEEMISDEHTGQIQLSHLKQEKVNVRHRNKANNHLNKTDPERDNHMEMDDLGDSTEGMEQDIEILEKTDNIHQSRTDSTNRTSEGDNPMDDTAANKRDVLGTSIDPTQKKYGAG